MTKAAIEITFKVMSISMGMESLTPMGVMVVPGMPVGEPPVQRYMVTISPVPDPEAAVQMSGNFQLSVTDPEAFTVGQSVTLAVKPA